MSPSSPAFLVVTKTLMTVYALRWRLDTNSPLDQHMGTASLTVMVVAVNVAVV
jgi:hypothetical protein